MTDTHPGKTPGELWSDFTASGNIHTYLAYRHAQPQSSPNENA